MADKPKSDKDYVRGKHCPTCLGRGWVLGHNGRRTCGICNGDGQIRPWFGG